MSDVTVWLQELEAVRAETLRVCAQVDDTAFRTQVHPDFSPIGWHLGHIGVTESYWILQRCKGEPSLSPFYDWFFTPTENPKANRVNLPQRAHILAYLDQVRERVVSFLATCDLALPHPLLQQGKVINMLVQHEEQHNETMTVILRLLAARREGTVYGVPPAQPQASYSFGQEDMVVVPGGPLLMGSDDDTSTLDNERPRHRTTTGAFLIDRFPVTNGQFLQFLLAGGYRNPSWWTPAGWQWRERFGVEHPLYWRRAQNGEWWEIGLTQVHPLALDHPVSHVSWYEADAYARFAGKRLPTEAEWEKAATWDPARQRKLSYPWGEDQPDARHCNYNGTMHGTTPVGRYAAYPSPYGCVDMLGNVWEWTATWFHPYPGFVAYPYEGYSTPYFDGQHRVLKGGSWATRGHVLRPTFRNWYHPGVREICAGFRCAKDV
ncbi:MAG: ergothioneine biosynthesis protein EgtB [Candidatus Binatia bacterium]|nr:ergothioneine biosynthesis protein EgtB [Candidatus Binatia bacterium]